MISHDQLAALTDRLAEGIAQLRMANIPEAAGQIAIMEQSFACLRELEAWRRSYPQQSMARTFNSPPYGITNLQ